MNFKKFEKEFQGKKIDFDNYAGFQCADGARVWVEDRNGWNMKSTWFKPYQGNGRYGDDGVLDGFYSFRDGHQSVVANREGVDKAGRKYKIEVIKKESDLKQGDLVFTSGSNQWGHVGIFVTRRSEVPNTFQLFDMNGDNPKRPAFWWSNYDKSTFRGAMRKIYIGDKPKPKPKPTPPKPKPPQKEYWTIQGRPGQKFWRSEVIQQIINAGKLKGTWQDYNDVFNKLNPIPTGGYPVGQKVEIPKSK